MSVLDTLITDRTAADVERLKRLYRIGWQNMTPAEQSEYLNGGNAPLYDANNQQLFDSQNEPLYSNDTGGGQKGAYNYTDLNRVETAVDYLADALVQAETDLKQYASDRNVSWDSVFDVPYDPDDYKNLTIKTDWAEDDIPSDTQMERYINNVLLIASAIPGDYDYCPDTMNGLDYSGANGIEKVLKQTNEHLSEMIDTIEGYIRSAMEVRYSGEIYSGEGVA